MKLVFDKNPGLTHCDFCNEKKRDVNIIKAWTDKKYPDHMSLICNECLSKKLWEEK